MEITVLQVIWLVLIAVLWTGYLVLEGFGIGAGMMMPLVAKNDRERTQVQKTFGPVWDGNEVWLLTAGGATFAAFPEWYATMFSGMYLALFLILLCLIVRICAIEWRSKISSEAWRARWDKGHYIAAWLVPILLGVAFANLVQGMNIAVTSPYTPGTKITTNAIDLSAQVHNFTTDGAPLGSVFLSLLTPYTILGGVMLALVFMVQGLRWLALRTDGEVRARSQSLLHKITPVEILLVAVVAIWGQFAYANQVLAWIPLLLAAVLLLASYLVGLKGMRFWSLFVHSAAIAGAVAWIFVSMAPAVMKSSINPDYSLTIPQAAASQTTLGIMLVVSVICVPCVLAYTVWSYSKMKLVIGLNDLDENPGLPWSEIRQGANFLSDSPTGKAAEVK